MVKLGEKQIDTITEKMDSFRSENFKFKTNMKQKFYDIEKSFNETKTIVDTDLHRLRTKVESQIEEQQSNFEITITNCKDTIIEAVQNDIAVGTKQSKLLREEFMQLIEKMSEEIGRKHGKHVNRYETFTINVEGRFSKLLHECKKASKLAEKVSIQGPSAGIYQAYGNHQAQVSSD